MSSIGSGSIRSGTTGDVNETSSYRSDVQMLRKHKRSQEEEEEGDLLEQRRSFQEGVFACMYTIVRQTALSSWKFAVLKIVLEGLMPFIVVFNPSSEWAIETGNPVWQGVRWVVWRSPIMRIYGYDVYIRVMYVMAGTVLLAVAGLVWLTLAMRKQEQSKWLRRLAVALHVVYELIFVIFYVSFMDFFTFTANCRFTDPDRFHEYFEGVKCLRMPHVLHMSVALVAAAVHFCVTALLVVASSDLNPLSRAYLASPDVISRLKILAAKAAFIIFANDTQAWPRMQSVLTAIAAGFICWYNFRKLPFYRIWVNVIWCSAWICVLYTCVVLSVLVFGKDASLERRRQYTLYILYGIFPVMAGGVVTCAAHAWWAMRPARKFVELSSSRVIRVQKLHRFVHVHEVELLSRVMRRFDVDGCVEDAAALGDVVIRAGMLSFPNSPFLYVLYANFLLAARKDGPAARTQLQLAAKHGPSLVERYQIYCTLEFSKRLKDSRDGGMDLQAYIEFRRNFKAVLRVHKAALALELELWRRCLRSTLRVAAIDALLDELDAATTRAHQVYRRVLERYPTNGKLLRCYGKFLEDVRHDPAAAARVYGEAARCGGADAIMSLDLSTVQQGLDKPDLLTSMSLVDDAVVVINAEGIIMMVSQAMQSVFGYSKMELEGANVSVLMPQPFSQRHSGYMARYVSSGEAHILDAVREVVALHKSRYVFPIHLCVTKMSGSGSDSVFLGVLRPLPPSTLRVSAWLAPNGIFLCGDQQFASLCGLMEKDLVGRSLASVCANSESEVAALLDRFREASAADLGAGLVRCELLLRHRFLEPAPVEVVIGLSGTEGQRIMAFSCRRTDGRGDSLLVVDTHMRLRFASVGISTLLNYPMGTLATMRLDQLLPPPYNALHAKWLRDPTHTPSLTGCRSGRAVHLLNGAGVAVPVRIKVLSVAGDAGMSLYVVQVEKVPLEELFEEKRLVVTADFEGRVQWVSHPDSTLFGFPALELLGRSLCDCIDVFGDWRKRNGESQLQLLILALIDREQEMPGASWRVRVHSPASDDNSLYNRPTPLASALPSMRRKPGGGAVSACLQVELLEDVTEGAAAVAVSGGGGGGGGGAPTAAVSNNARIKLTLWRRDLLTGVVELDEKLVIRKASPMTGLIVGLPSHAMTREPLHKFLSIPHHKTWIEISDSAHSSRRHKRSSMKSNSERGIVSPPMAFVGPHPDMGTMRIIVQGVQTLAPGGRQKVTVVLHPDTTFVGAHADLLRVLHLEELEGEKVDGEAVSRPSTSGQAFRLGAAGAAAAGGRGAGDGGGGSKEVAMGVRLPGQGAAGAVSRSEARRAARGGGGGDGDRHRGGELDAEEEEEEEEDRDGNGNGERDRACDGGREDDSSSRSSSSSGDNDDDSNSSSGGDGSYGSRHRAGGGSGAAGSGRGPVERPGGGDDDDGDDDDADTKGLAKLLRKASTKSEFVAQWVRTASKRILSVSVPLDSQDPDRDPDTLTRSTAATATAAAAAAAATPQAERRAQGPLDPAATKSPSSSAPATGPIVASSWPQVFPSSASPSAVPVSSSHPSALEHTPVIAQTRRLASIPEDFHALTHGSLADRDGDDDDGGGCGGSGGGGRHTAAAAAAADKWERTSEGGDSSADGSQAASGITSVTDNQSSVEMMVVDARRGKLLRSLQRLLMGPLLMGPLERLRLHSYGLLLLMLATHIACYVVVTKVVSREHNGVFMVFRQARAMDRASLLVVRILIGTFCERANNTAKVSACTPPLSVHLNNMAASIQTLEQDHQGVYLGFSNSRVSAPSANVYDIWTSPKWEYDVFFDTQPPRMLTVKTGVWQLGNRFIAASRDALYWMPKLRDNFKFHRVYQFMTSNGLGSLFVGYATSLDELMAASWASLHSLRTVLVIVLVMEVVVVQLSCLGYKWMLIHRLERARLTGLLSMVGLPGPVLRQMGNREIKILDESDDDEIGDDASAKDGGEHEPEGPASVGRKDQGDGEDPGGGVAGERRQLEPSESDRSGGNFGGGGGAAGGRTAAGLRLLPSFRTDGGGGDDDAADWRKGSNEQSGGKGEGGGRSEEAADPRDGAAAGECDAADGNAGRCKGTLEGTAQSTDLVALYDSSSQGATLANTPNPTTAIAIATGQGAPSRLRKAHWTSTTTGTHYINGKALIPSKWRDIKFMLVPLVWFAAVLAIYIASIMSLSGMQGPLATLNMASHVVYRYTRVRAVGFSFLTQDDTASRALWRDMLRTEVRLFASEYDALMYGGTAVSQANSVFTHAVPASTFASASFADAFFRTKRCFRYNQSLCAQPGSPYYEVTHNGLDVMVRRMITEMELLISDADEDVAYNGSRWTFMYNVGTFDLYEGLQQAAQLYVDYSISKYNSVTTLHTILLVVTIFLFLVYIIFVLWPYLAKLKADAARQSALLSHVPVEVDTVGHVKAIVRAARLAVSHRRAAAAVSAGASAAAAAAASKPPAIATAMGV